MKLREFSFVLKILQDNQEKKKKKEKKKSYIHFNAVLLKVLYEHY